MSSPSRLDAELKAAREKLTSEKLRRDSFQVCILWRLMQDQPLIARQVPPDLAKLAELAKSDRARAAATPNSTRRWNGASRCWPPPKAGGGVDRNASMHLLGHAALSLHQVFHPEKSPADQLSEIDATVRDHQQRAGREAAISLPAHGRALRRSLNSAPDPAGCADGKICASCVCDRP